VPGGAAAVFQLCCGYSPAQQEHLLWDAADCLKGSSLLALGGE